MNNNNKNYDKKYAINNAISVIPIENSNVGLKLVVSQFTKKNKTTQFVALNSDEFEYDLSDKKSFINLLHCLYSENHSQLNLIVNTMKKVGLIDNNFFKSLSNKNEDKKVNKNTRLEVSMNSNEGWILLPEKFKSKSDFINWMNENYKGNFIDDKKAFQQNEEYLKNYIKNNVLKVKEITIIDEIDTTSIISSVGVNENSIDTTSINNTVSTSDKDHIALKNSVDQLPKKTRDQVRKLATEKIKTFSPSYAKTGEYGRFPNKRWDQYDQMFSIWKDTYKEVLNIKETLAYDNANEFIEKKVNTLLNGSGNTEEEVVETIATSESGL